MKVVHTKIPTVLFKAPLLSPANVVCILTWKLNVLIALLVVYRSGGLWIKSLSVFVKPDVHFQHDFMLVLDKTHPSPGKLVYSTFPDLNQMLSSSNFRIPRVSNYETDEDEDGKLDKLNIEIEMPLLPNEEVTGVVLVLLFDWRITDGSSKKFRMESTAVLDYKSNSPGCVFSVSGNLMFQQKYLLRNQDGQRFPDNDMNSMLKRSLSSFESSSLPSFKQLLQEYFDSRNFSTGVPASEALFSWTNGRDSINDGFTIKAALNYPAQQVLYHPGFWYNIKWAFVQLFPTFIIIYFVMEWIRRTIFEQHMIPTVQALDS